MDSNKVVDGEEKTSLSARHAIKNA